MSNAAAFDGMTREERAGDWCVRLASANLSPSEQSEFDRWIASDPLNSEAFDRALAVWQGLHSAAETPEMIGMRADALNALRGANRRRWSTTVGGRLQWPLALAASLALVLVTSLFFFADRPQSYETATGERRTFVLADGSRLSLDAATKVLVDYDGDRRKLALLSGRAKFDVAKNSSRPFSVTAGEQTVVATGTAFSVERLSEKVHVIVYEGQVAVVPRRDPSIGELRTIAAKASPVEARLQPGKELIAPLEKGRGTIGNVDVARASTWEGGQLNFVDEPLADAVERLNRYEERKLVVADPAAGAIKVSGLFNAGDSEAFVEALEEAFPVRATRRGDRILLTSKAGAIGGSG